MSKRIENISLSLLDNVSGGVAGLFAQESATGGTPEYFACGFNRSREIAPGQFRMSNDGRDPNCQRISPQQYQEIQRRMGVQPVPPVVVPLR